ncbi:Rha family transcriptional regulator [Megalodesulfovibrio paquesii]
MSDLIPLDVTRDLEFHGDQPMVSSLRIAERFGKKHCHVLDSIRELSVNCPKEFAGPNFRSSTYTDPNGRTLPMFDLTRDGFSMLVMGFTGPEAMQWKVKYIEAFNVLEAAVKESLAQRLERAEAARQALEAERQAQVAKLLALPDERRQLLLRVMRYAGMGLVGWEIRRLTGLAERTLTRVMAEARGLGLIAPADKADKVDESAGKAPKVAHLDTARPGAAREVAHV